VAVLDNGAPLAQWLITNFIAELGQLVDLPEPIVEFGSLQVEPGQSNDLRQIFPGKAFIGTDLRPGPGVDRVEDLRSLSFGEREVGTALCIDTLEHCQDPLTACRELYRVLRPGGVCAVTSVLWFPIHGYPHDYWRFTPDGLRLLLDPFEHVWATGIGHPLLPTQVVAVAGKQRDLDLGDDSFTCLTKIQQNWREAPGRVRFGPVHVSPGEFLRAAARDLPRAMAQRAAARVRGGRPGR
jgi:SAM-dependent methyltransferase